MKRTFRIIEEQDKSGNNYFYVQQRWMGMWWTPSWRYKPIINYGYEDHYSKKFSDMETLKQALAEVREIMITRMKAYKKVVEVLVIEV